MNTAYVSYITIYITITKTTITAAAISLSRCTLAVWHYLGFAVAPLPPNYTVDILDLLHLAINARRFGEGIKLVQEEGHNDSNGWVGGRKEGGGRGGGWKGEQCWWGRSAASLPRCHAVRSM